MTSTRPFTMLSRACYRNRPAITAARFVQNVPRALYSSSTTAATRQHPMFQNPKENQTMKLPDGRTLGFAEYGDPSGAPVFWFHGTPSSRFEGYDWDTAGKKLKAHIIATDRPGFGLSTFQPGRTFMDWPKDVGSLAEHLGVGDKGFHVMGASGGGPFVVACANYFPKDVLKSSGIIAGVGPFNIPKAQSGLSLRQRIAFGLRIWTPGLVQWINRKYMEPVAKDQKMFREQFMNKFIDILSERDKAMFKSWPEEDLARFSETFREALSHGLEGDVHETQMLVKDWGYKLEDVDSNPIRIFWGDEDVSCSRAWQQYQADHLKNATLTIIPQETHFTIVYNKGEEILAEVLKL